MKSCDTQCQWHIYRMRRNIYIRTFTSRFPMIYCTSNTIYIVNESLSTNICRSIRPLMKCNDYYGSNRQPRHRHRCSPPIFHLLIWFLSVIYICNHIAIVCVFCLLTSIYSFIHSFILSWVLSWVSPIHLTICCTPKKKSTLHFDWAPSSRQMGWVGRFHHSEDSIVLVFYYYYYLI